MVNVTAVSLPFTMLLALPLPEVVRLETVWPEPFKVSLPLLVPEPSVRAVVVGRALAAPSVRLPF